MNHSCCPNTLSYEPNEGPIVQAVVVMASRDIQAGEEIYCSYLGEDGDDDLPLTERQAQLKWKYNFECCCSRCKSDKELVGKQQKGTELPSRSEMPNSNISTTAALGSEGPRTNRGGTRERAKSDAPGPSPGPAPTSAAATAAAAAANCWGNITTQLGLPGKI
jgi:hypothetical protein